MYFLRTTYVGLSHLRPSFWFLYWSAEYKNQNDGLKWERPTYVVLRKYTDYKLNPYNIEKNFKFYDTHDAVDIDYVKHCPKIDYFTTLNSPKSKI